MHAETCAEPRAPALRHRLPVRDYNLGLTLTSGQAFRWRRADGAWEGVVHGRWVRLREIPDALEAETAPPLDSPDWLAEYLQTGVDLDAVLATFPPDPPLEAAVAACRGLRLLRQQPWECLASFLLSSTKQIVQIQQTVELLCQRFGTPALAPPGHAPQCAFPTPARLAASTETELRACKMGFRAPHLLETARRVASGALDLGALSTLALDDARARLLELPGVGRKIADCVLLFACGFQEAFPVDVWVLRALHEWYFDGRQPRPRELRDFSETHFGPFAGYAQQYLFCYRRMRQRRAGLRGPQPSATGTDP